MTSKLIPATVLQVLRAVNGLQQSDIKSDSQLTCVDIFGNAMYIGNQKGTLSRIVYLMGEFIFNPLEIKDTLFQFKQKIDQIQCLYVQRTILVLSDRQVTQLFFDDRGKPQQPIELPFEKIQDIYINGDYEYGTVALISSKSEAIILKYSLELGVFENISNPTRIALGGTVSSSGCLLNNYMVVPIDKESSYYFYDVRGTQKGPIKTEKVMNDKNLFLRVINKNEIILQMGQNLIFFGPEGQIKPKGTINLAYNVTKKIISSTVIDKYLLLMFDERDYYLIFVYSFQESKMIQVMHQQLSEAKYIVSPNREANHCVLLSSMEFQMIFTLLSDNIIEVYLLKGHVMDAYNLLIKQNFPSQEEQKLKLGLFAIDGFWSALSICDMGMTKDQILNRNQCIFDLRELLILFTDLIPSKNSQFQYTLKQNKKFVDARIKVKEFVEQKAENSKNFLIEEKDKEHYFKDLLSIVQTGVITILERIRDRYVTLQDEFGDLFLNFTPRSKYAFNNIEFNERLTAENILELIDFALFSFYLEQLLEQPDEPKLLDFFRLAKGPIYIKSYFAELQFKLENNIQENNHFEIYARFYQNCDQIKQSFDTLKKHSSDSANKVDFCCESAIRLLGKANEIEFSKDQMESIKIYTELMKDNLQWILKQSFQNSSRAFQEINIQKLDPQEMLDFLANDIEGAPNLKSQYEETYLETIIHNPQLKFNQNVYRTQLCEKYIDKLFVVCERQMSYQNVDRKNPNLIENIRQLEDLIMKGDLVYDKILTTIRGSWLLEEQIRIYTNLQKYKEVRERLIQQEEFDWLQNYCSKYFDEPLALTNLFQCYRDEYQKLKKINSKQSLEKENQMQQRMMDFLNKHFSHPSFDINEVLLSIPQNWKIFDKSSLNMSNDFNLAEFLENVYSYTLQESRLHTTTQSINESHLLDLENSLVQRKQAYVIVGQSQNCYSCHNSILDQDFFVFPNGIIAHKNCITPENMSICPKTGINFKQEYKGYSKEQSESTE